MTDVKLRRLTSWHVAAAIIIVLGTFAYINSFEGAFVYDDQAYVAIPEVRQLWPPWQAMFGPTNISRPLIGLSLAVNYAISGVRSWSYHLFNLLVHLSAALTLFAIVRRTLKSDLLRERFGESSFALSLIVALVWMVHPLQTQAVTYIIQRCESLMGMFYLLTLYCTIRSFDSEKKRVWYAAAVAACAAGMMSKQVMATAPLVVLLYDVMFSSKTVKEAMRKRWPLYVGLSGTWVILAVTTILSPVNETAGFSVKAISPLRYFVLEFEVIVHYLRLSFWPDPLVLDYRWPAEESVWRAVPYGAVLALLGGLTVWGLMRRRAWGFAGAWFFVVLSVTSSFVPFSDLAFEHRMYLPLAGLVAVVVIGGYWIGKRWLNRLKMEDERRKKAGRSLAMAVVAVMLMALVFQTLRRNVDYRSSLVIWTDTVSKRPGNNRARINLGNILKASGMLDEALAQYEEARRLGPGYYLTYYNIGNTLALLDRAEEAKAQFEEAIRLKPDLSQAHYNLGQLLYSEDKTGEAIDHFQQAIKYAPNDAKGYFGLAQSLEKLGRIQEAIDNYMLALKLDPDWPSALSHFARLLSSQDDGQLRNTDEAVKMAEKAVDLTRGRELFALETLALAYAEDQRFSDAVRLSQQTIALASAQNEKTVAADMEERMRLYKAGRARPESANVPDTH
jgi:tetratricopeptide (TPR) repeat protein